jgi:3-methylfumaryl-CoA hydratase
MSSADLQAWVGRTSVARDVITPRLIRSFGAALSPHLADIDSSVPLGLHWCLAPDIADASRLGADGHPARGDFLPALPLPRRMRAGGELEFLLPLEKSDEIERRSRIVSVEDKIGRTGPLCFVTVLQEIETKRGVALRETQSIVYREDAMDPSAPPRGPETMGPAEFTVDVGINPILLFRYSALTFNGHRIHYDAPYAIQTEHYPGLVLHGPLQATYLLNLAARIGKANLRDFSFRALSPAAGITSIALNACRTSDHSAVLWVTDPSGRVAMKAEARW